MKKARSGDHWRHLSEKAQPNFICSVAGGGINNLPSGSLILNGTISVLTGLNGVGKSTVLHAIQLLLARDQGSEVSLSTLKEAVGTLTGTAILRGTQHPVRAILNHGSIEVDPQLIELNVTWIDTAFEIPALVTEFRNEQNLHEVLQQFEPSCSPPEEVARMSFLVGKNYSSCEVYELEDFGGRTVTPYFRVCADGIHYGTEGMGLGEAALHYVNWAIRRCPSDSLILIEEPETYVSAKSQIALMDLLAEACLRKNCTAVVTTHSPQIFAKVPPHHTVILFRVGGEVKATTKDSAEARLDALDVPRLNERRGFIFVEDRLAREFARVWLSRVSPGLLRHWRIVDVTSSGQILEKLKHFPHQQDRWLCGIGLFDGDERSKGHKSIGAFTFLPTDQAPEQFLRKAVIKNSAMVASDIRIDADYFEMLLSSLDGAEHHDWLLDLANKLNSRGISFDQLLDAAVDAWLVDNEHESARSLTELSALLSSAPSAQIVGSVCSSDEVIVRSVDKDDNQSASNSISRVLRWLAGHLDRLYGT